MTTEHETEGLGPMMTRRQAVALGAAGIATVAVTALSVGRPTRAEAADPSSIYVQTCHTTADGNYFLWATVREPDGRTRDGFCGDFHKDGLDLLHQTLSRPVSAQTEYGTRTGKILDYVLWHGSAGTGDMGGVSTNDPVGTTRYTVWMATDGDDIKTAGGWPALATSVNAFYAKAAAYADAGGGGREAGCAVVYHPGSASLQRLVVLVPQTGHVRISKSTAPTWRDGSGLVDVR